MTLWQKIKSWFGWKPKKKADTLAITDHRASFLFDNGKVRVMNILSHQVGEAQFENVIQRCRGNGDTVIYLYTFNVGDGGGATSIYVNDKFGAVEDGGKIQLMRRRFERCREVGLWVVVWLFPDDNGKRIPYNDGLQLTNYISQVNALFGGYISEYVIALEADEYFGYEMIGRLAQHIRTLTSKPIGCHQTPNKYNLSAHPLVNRHYHQYGWNKSVTEMESITRGVRAHIGKSLIACEYNLSSDSSNAKSQGRAAIIGGADGTGCGR